METKQYTVPGYFAADGNAAETSAESGNKWRVHFTPDTTGIWNFEVAFRKGENITILDDPEAGEGIAFDGKKGQFTIFPTDKTGRDFRGKGRIGINATGQYFQFQGSKTYFLKGGADSPENFLAYHEFDSTYRFSSEARDGEADPKEGIHKFEAHLQDWQEGDPSWQEGKGKAIIGALNYLVSKGMNSVYFLVMNINGDGKDVWPYTNYETRNRFDCSKLDQWEILFQHMEANGLLMHLVLQETENEKLLDEGETGPERKLFYRELIARFGHHLGLIWNLGEENGPADFSPNGQDNRQQKAMATYLKAKDPYKHPIIIHTHSTPPSKDEVLEGLLAHEPLDGLSFQVNKREQVHSEIVKWRTKAQEAGRPWLIGMDEIGFWHTGVMPDAVNPKHDTIRKEVLWGSLMAGAAGVEWYFGAKFDHNDLSCEDWRSRANMWDQTKYALDFFNTHLPYWRMESKDSLVNIENAFCLAKADQVYALYIPEKAETASLNLGTNDQSFNVYWYNPRTGGELQKGSLSSIKGPGIQSIGAPPEDLDQDWAVLILKE